MAEIAVVTETELVTQIWKQIVEINANNNSITSNNGVTARFVSKFVLPLQFRLPPQFPPIATFSVGNRLSHHPWISKQPIHSIHSSFA
jgi:hypothetical protein